MQQWAEIFPQAAALTNSLMGAESDSSLPKATAAGPGKLPRMADPNIAPFLDFLPVLMASSADGQGWPAGHHGSAAVGHGGLQVKLQWPANQGAQCATRDG